MYTQQVKLLGRLKIGHTAIIRGYSCSSGNPTEHEPMVVRLIELGLTKGSAIKVCHRAPFGGKAIVIDLAGHKVGLGLEEANLIMVEEVKGD